MISFIKFFIKSGYFDFSPKKFTIGLIVGLGIFVIYLFNISYIGKKQKIEEYKRIEQETKVFHEENIQKLKTTLNNAKNAKKSDFNDTGNLDDDYLLEALE